MAKLLATAAALIVTGAGLAWLLGRELFGRLGPDGMAALLLAFGSTYAAGILTVFAVRLGIGPTAPARPVSPINGALLIRREPPSIRNVPLLSGRIGGLDTAPAREPEPDAEADPPAAATVIYQSTTPDHSPIMARRDDLVQVCRMWPANPSRAGWRGTAANYGTACAFLVAHGKLQRAGRAYVWTPGLSLGRLVVWLDSL